MTPKLPSRFFLVSLVVSLLIVSSVFATKQDDDEDKKKVAAPSTVTYDGRSLLINGKRDLFFSGSIHYTRSTPEMWPDILYKAKRGGLNVIQTYVFWNIHEPVQGQYNFEGKYDVIKFIKMIQEHGMYVTLRIGPFIEAEWNFGGFPFWLKEVNNITFRADNAPFKYHMKKFTKMIIKKMKDEKLFAPQGGPIILTQIENEYNNVEVAYKDLGTRYVQWAGTMAVGLKTGVPWIMCKQRDAPDPVINTCNGRNCGDTFTGPNRPNKPSLWTENWTCQYRVFGDPPSARTAEDLAFAVARFFSKNGTLTNYYMYHGGTNFGRTASSFVTTRYYDEAPLDEFGLKREPKWGHLRDLHAAIKLCKKALLWGTSSTLSLGPDLEARIYEKPGNHHVCAAFIVNNKTHEDATATFRGKEYYLPPHSISILPDCKTAVFNSKMIVSQHNARTFTRSERANDKGLKWEISAEKIPTVEESPIKNEEPLELLVQTRDTTDYLWYITSFEIKPGELSTTGLPRLEVSNLGHVMHAFVNGKFVGTSHGNKIDKSFTFMDEVHLKVGTNVVQLLGMTVGLPDSGSYLEKRMAGVHAAVFKDLANGARDISHIGWSHKVGLFGEEQQFYTRAGQRRTQWTSTKGPGPAISWYKTHFDMPEGDDPVVVDMSTMAKGMIWVNGNNIGRYWVSYLSPLGKPTQIEYHIPRSYMTEKNNLLVIFEETGGNPDGIVIKTAARNIICSVITHYHPPHVSSWQRKDSKIRVVADDLRVKAHLRCPRHRKIETIDFVSYGNALGVCGNYTMGNCSAPTAHKIVETHCLGQESCEIPIQTFTQGNENLCPEYQKSLAIQAHCARST